MTVAVGVELLWVISSRKSSTDCASEASAAVAGALEVAAAPETADGAVAVGGLDVKAGLLVEEDRAERMGAVALGAEGGGGV